jgi:hypothetical protein
MLGSHCAFKPGYVEWLGLTTFLAFNQSCTDNFDIGLAGLITPDQVADIFTVIRESPRIYLAFYPIILTVGDGNSFAFGAH